jgi:hypothetical protein
VGCFPSACCVALAMSLAPWHLNCTWHHWRGVAQFWLRSWGIAGSGVVVRRSASYRYASPLTRSDFSGGARGPRVPLVMMDWVRTESYHLPLLRSDDSFCWIALLLLHHFGPLTCEKALGDEVWVGCRAAGIAAPVWTEQGYQRQILARLCRVAENALVRLPLGDDGS